MQNIWCFDAMQNQIHNGDDIGQRFFLFAVKRFGLEDVELASAQLSSNQILIGFTQEAS